MDLGAYIQIDALDGIAKKNGIEVPRLRGYRLMKVEKPVTKEEIEQIKKSAAVEEAKELIEQPPFWYSNPFWYDYRKKVNRKREYYLTSEIDEEGKQRFTGIRWDRIHGKKRKALKFAIKQRQKGIQKQFDTWNKYAELDGILYIHARIGGGNWLYYGDEVSEKPWFLEKVDDWWDCTYCDIYAKVKISEAEYAEFLALLEKENDNDADSD